MEKITYEYHQIANMYPMSSPNEFDLLKKSIKEKGQEQSIIIFENKILDGRNRYKACEELGIIPTLKEFNGTYDEALNYSIELNSGRRNLDKSQKAMVAAYTIEEAKNSAKISIKQASKIYCVSERYIKLALTILRANLSIAEQVFEGQETLNNAKRRINEISSKYEEINFIESNLGSSFNIDNELSDLYCFLYEKEKSELVNIIVRNKYITKEIKNSSE